MTLDGVDIFVVHGSPSRPYTQYVTHKDINEKMISRWFNTYPDVLVLGHTHVPFKKRVNDVIITNPGSVGQPRDGDNDAAFAMLDTTSLEIEFHRVSYNIEETAKKTKKYLPRQLAERLYAGK
jgi:putative phosphoesterase